MNTRRRLALSSMRVDRLARHVGTSLRQLHPSDDRRQRRAQLVGDRAEERVLVAVRALRLAKQHRRVDCHRRALRQLLGQLQIDGSVYRRRDEENVVVPEDLAADDERHADQRSHAERADELRDLRLRPDAAELAIRRCRSAAPTCAAAAPGRARRDARGSLNATSWNCSARSRITGFACETVRWRIEPSSLTRSTAHQSANAAVDSRASDSSVVS